MSLLLLWFFLSITFLWVLGHPCYYSSYPLNPFLIRCPPLYLSSLKYVIKWNCNLATLNTIWLVVHLTYEVFWNTSGSHGPSRFQMVLLHPIGIVAIWLRLLQLPVVLCHRFHSFFLLVTLFLIRMLLVSIFLLILEIVLLL